MSSTKVFSNKSVFSRETFGCLKGYLALCVLIHHLYQFTAFLSDTSFGIVFTLLGHWAVVMFIFMSGYGLSTSYLTHRETYLRTFPRKRLLTFYLTYLFFAVIYAIYELIIGSEITLHMVFRTLTYGGTIVSFGWYFQLTLLLYLVFFVTRLIKKDRIFLIVISLLIAAFVVYKLIIGESLMVYAPAVSFLAGVIFAHTRDGKKSIGTGKTVLLFIAGIIIFGLFTGAGIMIDYGYFGLVKGNGYVDMAALICMIIADLCLIVSVMSLVSIICKFVPAVIHNPVSSFLGVNCLEIYALQGLFLRMLYPLISSKTIYAIVSAVCIIGVAVPLHYLISLIMKRIKGTN